MHTPLVSFRRDRMSWTKHVEHKMRQYRLSPQRVARVMRNPGRTEKGIAPGTIASMQRTNAKRPTEIWAMYRPLQGGRIRVITAWRYPGRSPIREAIPIPADILEELKSIKY